MKKFAAVAVLLAAFGLRAEAQEKKDSDKGFYAIGPKSRIYIQGRAYIDGEVVWASGATNTATNQQILMTPRVTSNSSYLRFRGEYDLGEKWTSFAQIESNVSFDGPTAGSPNPFDSMRNSAIGISGPYGTLFFGYWDTPFKESTTNIDSWSATGIQSTYNVNGQMLGGTSASALTSSNRWNSRMANSISYSTPKFFEGAFLRVQAGTGESTATNTKRPYAVSAGLFYNGPLYFAAAYEYRKSYGTLNTTATPTAGNIARDGTDQGFRLAAQYKIKATRTRIGAGFEWLQYKNDANDEDLSKSDFFVDIVQGLGSDTHELVLTGGWASDYSGTFLTNNNRPTADTGAIYWSVGYRFNWTKDMYLYAVATQINNANNAYYNFGNGGISGFGAAMAGANPTGVALGMYYLF